MAYAISDSKCTLGCILIYTNSVHVVSPSLRRVSLSNRPGWGDRFEKDNWRSLHRCPRLPRNKNKHSEQHHTIPTCAPSSSSAASSNSNAAASLLWYLCVGLVVLCLVFCLFCVAYLTARRASGLYYALCVWRRIVSEIVGLFRISLTPFPLMLTRHHDSTLDKVTNPPSRSSCHR